MFTVLIFYTKFYWYTLSFYEKWIFYMINEIRNWFQWKIQNTRLKSMSSHRPQSKNKIKQQNFLWKWSSVTNSIPHKRDSLVLQQTASKKFSSFIRNARMGSSVPGTAGLPACSSTWKNFPNKPHACMHAWAHAADGLTYTTCAGMRVDRPGRPASARALCSVVMGGENAVFSGEFFFFFQPFYVIFHRWDPTISELDYKIPFFLYATFVEPFNLFVCLFFCEFSWLLLFGNILKQCNFLKNF